MTKHVFPVVSDFACSCGSRNKRRMALLHKWVAETFFPTKMLDEEWARRQYVTAMLYWLAAYGAWVDEIPLDPGGWGAIVASGAKNRDGKGLETHIQFDRFEDGLALTLRKFYKKFGPPREA